MSENPYYSLNDYFKGKYRTRVQRIAVSLPFKCPHTEQDGSGGCTYCHKGSMPAGADTQVPLALQIMKGIEHGRKRYGHSTKFMVYFQAYTNTNAPVEELKALYDEAMNHQDVIGISAGTRPDCAGDEVLKLLDSYYGRGFESWIELGLQSANNRTLARINRRHTVEDFIDAVKRAKMTRLRIAAHMIVGLPGEGTADFLETARLLAALKVHAVKIHPLHVMKGTAMGDEYMKKPFKILALEEYVSALADITEVLPPDMIMMRYTSEANDGVLLAPDYCRPEFKMTIRQMLMDELKRRGTRQGSKIVP